MRDPAERLNTLLLATDGHASKERLFANVQRLPEQLRPLGFEAAARVAPRLRGGRVYTDDVAPVEWLIDTSIAQFASTAATTYAQLAGGDGYTCALSNVARITCKGYDRHGRTNVAGPGVTGLSTPDRPR